MITVLRIGFGLLALFLFWFGSICVGEWIHRRKSEEINGERIMTIAHQLISVLLAIFFTMWCVGKGWI